jgi:hypothetical protein
MKNILTGRIDYLNSEDGETIRSTRTILATRSTVAKLFYILFKRILKIYKVNNSNLHPYFIQPF